METAAILHARLLHNKSYLIENSISQLRSFEHGTERLPSNENNQVIVALLLAAKLQVKPRLS